MSDFYHFYQCVASENSPIYSPCSILGLSLEQEENPLIRTAGKIGQTITAAFLSFTLAMATVYDYLYDKMGFTEFTLLFTLPILVTPILIEGLKVYYRDEETASLLNRVDTLFMIGMKIINLATAIFGLGSILILGFSPLNSLILGTTIILNGKALYHQFASAKYWP